MPLDDFLFLIAFLRPVCCQVIFLTMIMALSWRLETFHKILENSELSMQQNSKLIGKLLNKSADTIVNMNKLYSTNFMTSLVDLLFIALVTTFLAYDIIAHSLAISDVILMLGGMGYSFLAGSVCFSILIASSGLEEKKKKIVIKINDLSLKRNKLHKFLYLSVFQFDCLPLELSCGLFTLKKSHIFLMISSYFSYLIVMIQFDFMFSNQLNKLGGN
jgi:hypothetical protein